MRNLYSPPIAETRLNPDILLSSMPPSEILLPVLLERIQHLQEEKSCLQLLIGELLVKNQALRERLPAEDKPEMLAEKF